MRQCCPVAERHSVSEKRKHHRVGVDLSVGCAVDGSEPFVGVAKDISLGGMFVEAQNALPFGTAVTLSLRDMSDRDLELPAVVRWCTPAGFGVQFGLLGAYATYAITELTQKSRT